MLSLISRNAGKAYSTMRQKSVLKNEYEEEGERVKEWSSDKSICRHLNGLLEGGAATTKARSYESLGARLGSTFLRRFPETSINQIVQVAKAWRENIRICNCISRGSICIFKILEVGPPHYLFLFSVLYCWFQLKLFHQIFNSPLQQIQWLYYPVLSSIFPHALYLQIRFLGAMRAVPPSHFAIGVYPLRLQTRPHPSSRNSATT